MYSVGQYSLFDRKCLINLVSSWFLVFPIYGFYRILRESFNISLFFKNSKTQPKTLWNPPKMFLTPSPKIFCHPTPRNFAPPGKNCWSSHFPNFSITLHTQNFFSLLSRPKKSPLQFNHAWVKSYLWLSNFCNFAWKKIPKYSVTICLNLATPNAYLPVQYVNFRRTLLYSSLLCTEQCSGIGGILVVL